MRNELVFVHDGCLDLPAGSVACMSAVSIDAESGSTRYVIMLHAAFLGFVH
jgi:hypothetical protein